MTSIIKAKLKKKKFFLQNLQPLPLLQTLPHNVNLLEFKECQKGKLTRRSLELDGNQGTKITLGIQVGVKV